MNQASSRVDRIAVRLINALSILIPISLLICFLLAARPRSLAAHDIPLCYTITMPAVREEYLAGLAEDVPVMDAVSKRPIGHLISYTIEPAMTQSYSERAGRMRLVEYPGHATVRLTICAEGRAVAGGYSLAGFTLFRGKQISLRLPNFVGTGTCTVLEQTP